VVRKNIEDGNKIVVTKVSVKVYAEDVWGAILGERG